MLRRRSLLGEAFEPWEAFERMLRRPLAEIDEILAPLTTRRLLPALPRAEAFVPAAECFAKDKQLIVKMELPGVDPKQVEVLVTGNTLTIKGEKKEERKIEETDYFFREVAAGRFERSFTLPEGVKKEQVVAAFQNGVLEITVPTPALEAGRKVPIEIHETGKKAIKAA
jgi:HSP20 family protein